MIGFKKIPKKTVLTVFIVAVLSILLVYVDTQYNDPLPIEEVKFSKELKKKPGPIKNKLIHVVQKGDSLSVIFDEKEIPLNTAYKIFNSDKNNLLTSIKPDDVMEFSYLGNTLESIQIYKDDINSIVIEIKDDIFIKKVVKEIQIIKSFATGSITSSFYKSALDVGIPDSIIMDFAYIFGWDIDFILDVRQGDQFSVIYETDYSDGEKISSGDIIFAEFINKNEIYIAQRFYDDIQGKQLLEGLQWLGVSNQFFSTNIFLEKPYETKIWAARHDDGSGEGVRVIAALGLPNVTLNPGDSMIWNYEIFLGPKDYQTLKVMEGERSKIVGFDRMPIFGWIAQPFAVLLSLLMNWLHGFFGNYGWSIISITIIMRLVIWPVTAKGTRAMKKMSKLAPMMQEIKEKYKDNPQKMQQETMSLYRDYGVNPVGGCLPLLLQMPIFIGYFAMLRAAVELRHEPWLGWVTDLSLPDTVMHIAGFPVNILPLLMGITMMLQMRMTPQSAGPNQKQMKIIMTIMPIFITVICYNFASALALYWTAGNIFSIGQTWVTQKFGKEVELKKVDRSMQRPALGSPHQSQKKANKPAQIRTGGRRKKKK